MLLSFLDTKRTLMLLFLFTNTTQREPWFQYVRRVYATAINFSCISTLYTPIFLTCCLFVYIPIYLSAVQYLVYLVYLSIFLSDFLNLINSSRPNFFIFSHCSACTMKDGCSKGDHKKNMFYQIDFWTVQNCRVFFSYFINTIVVMTEFWDTLYRRTDRETNLQMGGSD